MGSFSQTLRSRYSSTTNIEGFCGAVVLKAHTALLLLEALRVGTVQFGRKEDPRSSLRIGSSVTSPTGSEGHLSVGPPINTNEMSLRPERSKPSAWLSPIKTFPAISLILPIPIEPVPRLKRSPVLRRRVHRFLHAL